MEIRSFWLVFFLFLCSVNLTFGVNVELGTKVLVQPDGTKVTAREFVDESGRYLSTSNGFVVKDPKTGYYHYLQYDDVGGSSPSALRAGIDDQSPDMAQLRKKNEQGINARVQTASRSVEETPIPGEFDSLIVILVEFDDVTHDSRYTDGDFYSMLFGRNYARTPDGEEVYGSMYQYWSDMSCGTYEVRGRIANQIGENDSGDPIPEWIALGRDKGYFHGVDRTSFIGTALDSAVSQQGIDVSTSDRRKLCIIYAGYVYFPSDVGKGLVPAWNLGYRTYTMSEKWAAPHTGNSETDLAKFSHIGAHCHEYGHSLGLPDMYYKKPREGDENHIRQFVEYKEWGLMASGAGKATSASTWGDNPAPVTPHFRADLGWIQPSPVNSHGQRTLTYSSERQSYQSDVYRISSHGASKDFFLIENRQTGSGWNIGPVADDKDGLLIWHVRDARSYRADMVDLIEADGDPADAGTEAGDFSHSLGANKMLSFPDGTTTQTFTVTANQDDDSDDESVNLSFGTLPSGVVAGTPATVSLVDDDDTPGVVSIDPATAQVGTQLTATLSDADEVVSISGWQWNRRAPSVSLCCV